MAGVPPWAVAALLGALLCGTTYLYFFSVPAVLKAKSIGKGVWGTPNAEFNWCELDYQLTEYVAEPANTATGFLYIVFAWGAWRYHAARFDLEPRLHALLLAVAAVGVGTVLFHATLRYSMQLLDELPIYYLILIGAWALHERGRGAAGPRLAWLLAAWAGTVSVLLLATPQQAKLHQAFRGIMACSFSLCFVYIFWAAAKASEERRSKGDPEMQDLFSQSFLWFVLSIVCWVVDNMACDVLQQLRWYPNFHAWGWHCGTVAGMHYMFLALLVQRQQLAGRRCAVSRLAPWLPVPVVRPAAPHAAAAAAAAAGGGAVGRPKAA